MPAQLCWSDVDSMVCIVLFIAALPFISHATLLQPFCKVGMWARLGGCMMLVIGESICFSCENHFLIVFCLESRPYLWHGRELFAAHPLCRLLWNKGYWKIPGVGIYVVSSCT